MEGIPEDAGVKNRNYTLVLHGEGGDRQAQSQDGGQPRSGSNFDDVCVCLDPDGFGATSLKGPSVGPARATRVQQSLCTKADSHDASGGGKGFATARNQQETGS